MPNRPRQHVLEDLAHAALRQIFSRAGWTMETLTEDYGEDFLVRIFCDEQATPYSMYLQSKATDSLCKYMAKDGRTIRYPIGTNHLTHWERFWEPVVLTVYDATTDRTYWRVIQPWLEQLTDIRRNRLLRSKSSSISIPVGNLLDESAITRLNSYTEHRFNRFRREQDGANHLIKCLKETIGLEVSYDAQEGILIIPNGSFQSSDGGARCHFFGRTGAKLSELAKVAGKSEEQTLIDAINYAVQELGSMSKSELAKRNREFTFVDDA